MKCIIEMYELNSVESRNKSKLFLRKIHLDDIKHFAPAIKYLLENEFEDSANKITLRLKKFKNGKHQIYYDLIDNKTLKHDVKNFIESSFPIIA